MELHPIGARIDKPAFRIGVDQTVARADVTAAVAVMKSRRGKFKQIDRVAFHHVFHQRRGLYLLRRNRFAGFHFAREQTHDFELAFVRRDAECQRGSFVIGERKTDQSKAGGITFDLVEQSIGRESSSAVDSISAPISPSQSAPSIDRHSLTFFASSMKPRKSW